MRIQKSGDGWITSPHSDTSGYIQTIPYISADSGADQIIHYGKRLFGLLWYRYRSDSTSMLGFYPQFKEVPSCFFKSLKEIQEELVFFIDIRTGDSGAKVDNVNYIRLFISLEFK